MIVFSGKCSNDVISQTEELKIWKKHTLNFDKVRIIKLTVVSAYLAFLLYWLAQGMLILAGPPGWEKVLVIFLAPVLIAQIIPMLIAFCLLLSKMLRKHTNYLLWIFDIVIDNSRIEWNMYLNSGYLEACGRRHVTMSKQFWKRKNAIISISKTIFHLRPM